MFLYILLAFYTIFAYKTRKIFEPSYISSFKLIYKHNQNLMCLFLFNRLHFNFIKILFALVNKNNKKKTKILKKN